MRKWIHSTLGLCLLGMSQIGMASPTLVLQVPETYHKNPVRLLHPYLVVWHNRANAAQQAGIQQFNAQQIAINTCDAGAQGQALMVIEPNVFYNPKMGVFYSEIKARVFLNASIDASLTKPVLMVTGTGSIVGNIATTPEFFIQKAYAKAYDEVIKQLQANDTFNTSVAKAPTQTYQALCTSIDTISQPKLFF